MTWQHIDEWPAIPPEAVPVVPTRVSVAFNQVEGRYELRAAKGWINPEGGTGALVSATSIEGLRRGLEKWIHRCALSVQAQKPKKQP